MTASKTPPLLRQEFSASHTKLGALLDDTCFQNGIYKHSDEYGAGTPILRITDFDNHGRLTTNLFSRVALSPHERDQYVIRENDIIINRVNSLTHIGKSMLVRYMREYPVFESNMMRIRISEEAPLAPEYVAAVLQAGPARRHFRKVAKPAVAQASINQDDVRAVALVLHPKPVQRRIAKALLTWDIALEKTEQLIAAKERHYSHELSRLISRGQHPGASPAPAKAGVGAFAEEVSARNRGGEWRTVSLSDIATVWKGEQLNKNAMVEDGAYYALNGGIKPSGRTTEWNCDADTITVSSGGNSCGFIRFNFERFWCGGDCFALKNLLSEAEVSYLFHYLKGQQHRMMALRTGSGIPHVYRADVEAFPVVLPNLATQTAIARYLSALREEIDLLGQSVAALKTQKRGLMQKLLTGQWRVPVSAPQSQHGDR